MTVSGAVLEQLRGVLVRQAGGYLRNTIREPRLTCGVCATPCPGYDLCYTCRMQLREPGQRADQVASLIYAVDQQQSGYVMRNYKARPRPVEEHRAIVAMTAMLGLGLHGECARRHVGRAVTHWATIPSLPARPGEHPLRRLIVRAATPGEEVGIVAADTAPSPRAISPDHFVVSPLPQRAHVLLVDDTWASGGHAQSAVLAARTAGAAYVSVLTVARWIDPRWEIADFGNNDAFLRSRCTQDYDPTICPWTGTPCR